MSSINCNHFTELAKKLSHKPDLEFHVNRQDPYVAREFYTNSAENLQEELTRIGALIRLLLEKLNPTLEGQTGLSRHVHF